MLMRLDSKDNVAVMIADGKKGQTIKCGKDVIELISDIPFGHKCALVDINAGEKIIKYGCPIGYALTDIKKGELIREHNMAGLRGRGDI